MERRPNRRRPDQRMLASDSVMARNLGRVIVDRNITLKHLATSSGLEPSSFWRIAVGETKNPVIGQAARVLTLLGEEEAYRILGEIIPASQRQKSREVLLNDAPIMQGKFASQVRAYRELRGYKRGDLATEGLSVADLDRTERGVSIPRINKFAKLIFALGLNPRQTHTLLQAAADEYRPRVHSRNISEAV